MIDQGMMEGSVQGFFVVRATGRIWNAVTLSIGQVPMPPDGMVWVAQTPDDPTDPKLHAFEPIPDDAPEPLVMRRIPKPPEPVNIEWERAAALSRIDTHAGRRRDAIRPAAMAAVDAERVRQAREVASDPGTPEWMVPLVAAAPGATLAEKASGIIAAHALTMAELARIEADRLAAKAAARAMTDPEQLKQIHEEPKFP
jgi:hypothetical protein